MHKSKELDLEGNFWAAFTGAKVTRDSYPFLVTAKKMCESQNQKANYKTIGTDW